MSVLDRRVGREVFGIDPGNYDAARPPYPDGVWRALRERAGLAAGIDIVEIGPGSGIATRPLLMHRPARLVAVEPDARLAAFLRAASDDPHLQVIDSTFESAELPLGSFDLACCATAFHWLDARAALSKIHGLLRPGGAWAMWWNEFGDPARPDPFHLATAALFADNRRSPSQGESGRPVYALDTEMRLAELATAGFAADPPQVLAWTLTLDTAGVRALYSTYSGVNALSPETRERLLDGLAEVAEHRFAGCVERNMLTVIYTARSR